jgi:hypothetical protein
VRRTSKPRASSAPRRPTNRLESYWSAARTPLHSLLFLLPMVAFYEAGIVWVQRDHLVRVRNGGDVMLRRLVALVGRPGVAASALLLVAVLLLWQALSRRPWRVRLRVLPAMLAESAGLGAVLYLFALVYGGRLLGAPPAPSDRLDLPIAAHLVLCFGNGVYEELVFRLLLVAVLMVLFNKGMGLERTRAVLWAVGLSALAFAVAHYVGPLGDAFAWHSFAFRFVAGVFFSFVLAFRGFGIAAGTHALYDVAVVLTQS